MLHSSADASAPVRLFSHIVGAGTFLHNICWCIRIIVYAFFVFNCQITLCAAAYIKEIYNTNKLREEFRCINNVPVSEIDPFPGHPFWVLDDEDM